MKPLRNILGSVILMLVGLSEAMAEDLSGEFVAVTESELVIELYLKHKGSALIKAGYLPTEDGDSTGVYTRSGTWRVKNKVLYTNFNEIGELTYRIVEYLPYSEFDSDGGSFGLSPVTITSNPITRHRLWRRADISRLLER
jgi:hypothetical protein